MATESPSTPNAGAINPAIARPSAAMAAALVALLAAGFALRLWNLDLLSFWWDEAYTIETVRHDLGTFWELQIASRHPPLYFLAAGLWGNVASWSEYSIRFLSVASAMAGLALTFRLTQELFHRSAAVATLAVLVAAPALVIYAQEARMYTAMFALAALTLYAAARSPSFSGPRLIVAEAAFLLTHFFAVPLVVAMNVVMIGLLVRRRAGGTAIRRWVVGQAMAALPLALWAAALLTTGSLARDEEPATGLLAFSWQTIVLWASGAQDPSGVQSFALFAALSLTIFVAAVATYLEGRRAMLVVRFGVLGFFIAAAFTAVAVSFHPRFMLAFSLPLIVLAGVVIAGIAARPLRRRLAGGAAIVATIIAGYAGWSIAADIAKDDVRAMAAYIREQAAPGDIVIAQSDDYGLAYYPVAPAERRMIRAFDDPGALAELRTATEGANSVWLVDWIPSRQDPRGYWPYLLEDAGRLDERRRFSRYQVSRYRLDRPIAPVAAFRATGGPSFGGVEVAAVAAISSAEDGAVTVIVAWRRGEGQSSWKNASLRLKDPSGQSLSLADMLLLDQAGRPAGGWDRREITVNYYVLSVPPATPPGRYEIAALLYDGAAISDEHVLGSVELLRPSGAADPYETLATLPWQTADPTALSGRLALDAYLVGPELVEPGAAVDVTLRWRRTQAAAAIDGAPSLQLIQGETIVLDLPSELLLDRYPIERWAPGESIVERRRFRYPVIAGETTLRVGSEAGWIELARYRLDPERIRFDAPGPEHRQAAQFGEFARLAGFDLPSTTIAPGGSLDLTLYWQAVNEAPLETAYTVFAHLSAPDGRLIGQHDGPPAAGARPTDLWVPGEVIVDRHAVGLSDEGYRGPATLLVGWYDSATIERVLTGEGTDSVTLAIPVTVVDP